MDRASSEQRYCTAEQSSSGRRGRPIGGAATICSCGIFVSARQRWNIPFSTSAPMNASALMLMLSFATSTAATFVNASTPPLVAP
jgi:hypothetical protein